MKKFTLLMAIVLLYHYSKAQDDSTVVTKSDMNIVYSQSDTIRIGNMVIINKNKKNGDNENVKITFGRDESKKISKVRTNWMVFDFGFANYNDQTDYANTGTYLVNKPGSAPISQGTFDLRTGKSVNVNIWLFMQRLSLVKNYLNLKYGFGLELNNYRYTSNISYKQNGTIPYSGGLQTSDPFIFTDSIVFDKNKLALDYVTVPFMLNYSSNPYSSYKGLTVSFGVSVGYLYNSRNKQISSERGKLKNKGEYDIEQFKMSYVAELGIGPICLYGSYAFKSMYEHSLDMRPYNVGIRFSGFN